MSRTFSYLRSNDLIYGPAIRSYMLGEAPPAFDLLYWNGDGTNLPARMTVEYLRWLCQQDRFAQGKIEICGETLSLKGVKVPLCAIACETDHIAAWKSSFRGVAGMGSRDKTFILSESGHIAGIVNPPDKRKYGHYTSDAALDDPEEWRAGATRTEGSWWPRWQAWLGRRSGAMIDARTPGSTKGHPALCPAPGTYVRTIPKE
jgi:polyhydroxyalkanoate synthase